MTQGADGTLVESHFIDRYWNESSIWQGGTIAGNNTSSYSIDTATVNASPGSSAGTILIDEGRTLRSIRFTSGSKALNIGSFDSSYALTFSSVTSGSNIILESGHTGDVNVYAPIILQAETNTSDGLFRFGNYSLTGTDAGRPGTPKLNIRGSIRGGETSGDLTIEFGGSVGSRLYRTPSLILGISNVVSGSISDGQAGSVSVKISGDPGGPDYYNAWNFIGSNTYSGNTTVSNGALFVHTLRDAGATSSIGRGDTIELQAGGHFLYVGPSDASTNRTIISSGGGQFSNQTTGSVITLNGSIQTLSSIVMRGNGDTVVNGVISGAGGLSKTGIDAVLELNNTNTFTGELHISAGILRTKSVADAGIASGLGASAVGSSTIKFGQDANADSVGHLQYHSASNGSTNRNMLLRNGAVSPASGSGATLENSSPGASLTLSGNITASSADHQAYLRLTGVGKSVLSGNIGGTAANPNASLNLTFIKDGTGLWELKGANHFQSTGAPTGVANIKAGTLLVNNTTGSALGTSSVDVSGVGTKVGGTGSITGGTSASITLGTGTALMIGNTHQTATGMSDASGYTGAASVLTLGGAHDVALSLQGDLLFDLYSNDAGVPTAEADRLNLHSTHGSITLGGTVRVADMSGSHAGWTSGSWQLINWDGLGAAAKLGSFSFVLPTASLADGYYFDTNNFLTTGIIAIAPEPHRMMLLLTGMMVIMLRRRRLS